MFNKFLPLPGKAFPVFQYKSESNVYPAPSDFKKKQNFAFFSVILLAVSSFDYVSSVLTGSVTWVPTDKLVTLPGNIIIPCSTTDTLIENYKKYTYKQVAQEAHSDAVFVWGC